MHQHCSRQYTGRLILAVFFLAYLSINGCSKNAGAPSVGFENKTQEVGLAKYSNTFSIVVTDADNDGTDDLLVGNHDSPPTLYLNNSLQFIAQPDALPIKKRADRHGYTFADFDNDGDKDFVVAGGGADGIGTGTPSEVYKNLLIETNRLEFVDVTNDSDISNLGGRTRHFFPIANLKGDKVDLYSTGLHKGRKDSKNLYAVNNSTPAKIIFNRDESSSLHRAFASDGKDLFFDFDRDSLVDFLRIGEGQAVLYRNVSGQFTHFPLRPDNGDGNIGGVISGVSADLNNDGYPDLYLGGANGRTNSDNVVSNSQEIHFSLQRQEDDQIDSVSFRMETPRLKINFKEHIPSLGKARTDPTDIFIGANKGNPTHRKAEIDEIMAAGKPEVIERPGIYIWYEKEENLWRLLCKHDEKSELGSSGVIYSEGIKQVQSKQFETIPARESQDVIVLNQQGKGWKVLVLEDLKHHEWTPSLTAADFNNDGLIDIVGLRTQDDGKENGNPFIVLNHGNLEFSIKTILENTEDNIFRADIIVHGFFNDDGLPDIFYTNGYGLPPTSVGPYQFWLNSTKSSSGYLLLELEGTRANRDAIGAQIELYDMEEKLLGYRELGSNFGRGQNTHKIHFGLGDKQGPFNLKIRWPGSSELQQLLVNRNSSYHVLQN
jgi:FG-GAP-like repeat/ASPIC and UnbV